LNGSLAAREHVQIEYPALSLIFRPEGWNAALRHHARCATDANRHRSPLPLSAASAAYLLGRSLVRSLRSLKIATRDSGREIYETPFSPIRTTLLAATICATHPTRYGARRCGSGLGCNRGHANRRRVPYQSHQGGKYAIPDSTHGHIDDGPLHADHPRLFMLCWAARASDVLIRSCS